MACVNKLRRFWEWLRYAEYPAVVHVEAARAQEVPEPQVVDPLWRDGYIVGHAQGEIHGRNELAREIERMFPEHKAPMDAEDAKRIRSRQMH